MPEPSEAMRLSELKELTREAQRRRRTHEFAGFLTREDTDAIYIADPQGTWVISREDALFVEEWEFPSDGRGMCPPDYMRNAGRPVRVGIREGATIYEIRPWKMVDGDLAEGEVRRAVERVFTLGGEPLPLGEQTRLGENRLAELARTFARRRGWHPDDPCTDPRAAGCPGSHTIVVNDGYCDVDECF